MKVAQGSQASVFVAANVGLIRIGLILCCVLALAAVPLGLQSQAANNSQTFGSYVWISPQARDGHALGVIAVIPSPGNSPQPVLAPEISSASGVLKATSAAWNTTGSTPQLLITVEVDGSPAHITVTPQENKGRLQAQIAADRPGITDLTLGGWPSSLGVRLIPVPYYTNTVTYLSALKSYANAWLDWHTTGSAELSETHATYRPLTNGKLLVLNEQLNLVVAPAIGAVFPSPGNPVSPYLAVMNGRMVVDVWSGSFESIAQNLATLGSYGVTNCLVILHNWQHHGYDNALPDHYPANPQLGGDTELEEATEEARSIGCLVAVHENYVDYYPNYDHFTPAAIVLDSDGSRQTAWLNTGTGIQSFATKPNWVIKNASTESPVIHQRYGTTASYLDVYSGTLPGIYVDMDATQPGAGLVTTRDQSSASLWNYLRQTHQGPALGEGTNHWYNSGLLDGVEAQTGAGATPQNIGAQLPLFVNFDLFDIHPFQVNHGMGYVSRWTTNGGNFSSTGDRDAYRMQEIAFGHAPFLDDSDFGDASRAMTESALVTPVASRYGLTTASSIEYLENGKNGPEWVSASQAALTGAFHQVKVAYKNGLTVTANRAVQPLVAEGVILPQFGWLATGQGIKAFTAMCGTVICDYAQTDSSIFANARNQSDVRIGASFAGPSVAAFQQTGPGAFNISYDWKVYQTTALNLIAFVHFVDPNQTANEGIVFQGDFTPTSPTSGWKPGQTVIQGPFPQGVPSNVPDGTYSVRIGLYDPVSGDRIILAGQNDGDNRFIIGSVTVSQSGAKIEFTPVAPRPNDPRLNAGGSVLTFPAVQTDGMFSLNQEYGNWVLRPFPRFRNFTILIQTSQIAMPPVVSTVGGTGSTVTPKLQGIYWKLPLNGASSYSWPVE